jgi:hypothetical protein
VAAETKDLFDAALDQELRDVVSDRRLHAQLPSGENIVPRAALEMRSA